MAVEDVHYSIFPVDPGAHLFEVSVWVARRGSGYPCRYGFRAAIWCGSLHDIWTVFPHRLVDVRPRRSTVSLLQRRLLLLQDRRSVLLPGPLLRTTPTR